MESLKKDEILKAAFAIQPMQVPEKKQPLAVQPIVAAPAPQHKK